MTYVCFKFINLCIGCIRTLQMHRTISLSYSRIQSFILNLRIGSSANPFLYRPFPFLPERFHGHSDHLIFWLCATAGFVRMVC